MSGPPIEQNSDAVLDSDEVALGANSKRDSALSIVLRYAPATLRFCGWERLSRPTNLASECLSGLLSTKGNAALTTLTQ